jgi:predicted homoserine dehydrogenase-like protein
MLKKKLEDLESSGKKISIGIIGVGRMGKSLTIGSTQMKGAKIVGLADVVLDRAISTFKSIGYKDENISLVNMVEKGEEALKDNKVLVTENAFLLPEIKGIDVIIDATGKPEVGAKVALRSILNKTHIVMLTDEADAVVGPYLKVLADRAGVVYSGAAGDEPGAIMELYNFANTLGFDIIAVGKGKNNPLNREATPQSLKIEAKTKGLNPRIYTSFVDGSNTMLEMTLVANATSLSIDKRGMHGPKIASIKELPRIFNLKSKGGILNKEGIVDFVVGGGIAPGVFLIMGTHNDIIRKDLEYLGLGKGPNYYLYRPYHIPMIEPLLSSAKAVLFHEASIAPIAANADTITIAKRDLVKGEVIDGIGGSMVYGLIEKMGVAREDNLVPISLTENAKVKRDVKKGIALTYEDIELIDNELLQLRKLQDSHFT